MLKNFLMGLIFADISCATGIFAGWMTVRGAVPRGDEGVTQVLIWAVILFDL